MAINSKNFVDISTTFPKVSATNRAFGGLVFTVDGLIGIPTDSSGKPIPKNENGEESYSIDINGTTYPFAWDDTEGYMVKVGNTKYYPANSYEISLWISFNSGSVIALSLDEVLTYFGYESKEYEFATGYYSYTSPSGRFPGRLKFVKLNSGKSLVENFRDLDKETNDFGSFTYLNYSTESSSSDDNIEDYLTQLVDVALYNSQLDTKYLFVVNQKMRSGGSDFYTAIKNCGGVDGNGNFAKLTGTCYVYGASDVSAYMPMAILASTDYQNGQVVNFMFKQFSYESPTVKDQIAYSALNQGLVNFYGQTQSNGQTLNFYQRGFNTNGTDTALYCNEMWFKAECETSLLDLLVSSERISADQNGVAQVKITVADACSKASNNGCFMQKDASAADRKVIREIVNLSGGEEQDVEGIVVDVGTRGYSIYAYIAPLSDKERLGRQEEKIIVYYVFYGTADSIRYVKGNDILLK